MYFDKRSIVLAASLILSAGAAFPQDQAKEGRRGAGHFAEALSLTDSQKEQAKAIHSKYQASTQEFRTQMRSLHEQLKAAREANNTAEVERLNQQREALFAKAKETRTAERNEFRSILTADQQAKLDQMPEKWGNRHKRGENK